MRGVALAKEHPRGGQAVQVRGVVKSASIGAKVTVPKIIAEDEEEVWASFCFGASSLLEQQ